MRRREFITLLGAGAAAWPLAARAQQAGKLPTIGFLGSSSASGWSPWTAAFVQRLNELGWVEGRTVAIEYRWADGRSERFAEIAAEFVRLKVDVIVTSGLAVPAAKQVTSVIPIVFAVASDPVGTGMIASLARPGGNVTGLSQQSRELAGKRLELLREIVPALHRLAAMGNVGSPSFALEIGDVQAAVRALGLDVATFEIRRGEDIVPAFAAIKDRADALYVIGSDPLIVTKRVSISTLAAAARLPTVHSTREYVEAGGLLSYGPNYAHLFWRAGNYVDKILRGAKPGDLPVEQPTKFELVNLTTAIPPISWAVPGYEPQTPQFAPQPAYGQSAGLDGASLGGDPVKTQGRAGPLGIGFDQPADRSLQLSTLFARVPEGEIAGAARDRPGSRAAPVPEPHGCPQCGPPAARRSACR